MKKSNFEGSIQYDEKDLRVELKINNLIGHSFCFERNKTNLVQNTLTYFSLPDLLNQFFIFLENRKNEKNNSTNIDETLTNSQLLCFEPLTSREIEILQQLDSAMTIVQLAKKLFISENTLKFHLRNLYSKLDVHCRSQAVEKYKKYLRDL